MVGEKGFEPIMSFTTSRSKRDEFTNFSTPPLHEITICCLLYQFGYASIVLQLAQS